MLGHAGSLLQITAVQVTRDYRSRQSPWTGYLHADSGAESVGFPLRSSVSPMVKAFDFLVERRNSHWSRRNRVGAIFSALHKLHILSSVQ